MRWLYLGMGLLLCGCTAAGTIERPPGELADLPATFRGTLPCADCPGIDYHLNLFPDGSYYLRTRYGDRPDGTFDDIGRFLLSSDGALVSLHGGREAALRFSIDNVDSLRLMGVDGTIIVSDLNYSLRRQAVLEPFAPRLTLRGMYRYMADAARFSECLTGRDMPVAMEADNVTLERAYLEARVAPGAPVMVSVDGQIAQRMPMEGPGPTDMLVPERFIGVFPGATCDPPVERAPLLATRWRATQLAGDALTTGASPQTPTLLLHADGSVSGSDGCNRLLGRYRIEGDSVEFSGLASTMMACASGMAEAEAFKAGLGTATHYRVVGSLLELLDAAGDIALRFEAMSTSEEAHP